ncbi:ROK family protein [Acidobacteriota bacterium]
MATVSEKSEYYVGIDLGGTLIKAALVSGSGNVEFSHKEPTVRANLSGLVDQLLKVIQSLADRLKDDTVCGAGIGVPGNVDSETTEILASPNLQFTAGLNVRQALGDRLPIPLAVDNDGNAGALGEHRFGAGRGARNMVYICLGTGVGGGLILEGKPFRGSKGYGAELGHTNINPDGKTCLCGGIGCLELEVCAPSIVRRARQRLAVDTDSALKSISGREITAEDVSVFAGLGDEVCRKVLAETGRRLGIALADFVNIFNPDVIIVGGGVSRSGELLLDPAVDEASKRAFPDPFRHCKFRIAELGDMAGVLGAAALAMEM